MQNIKVWNYIEDLSEERADLIEAFNKVLDSGILILGEQVRQFEEAFANYCGVKYGVGVNSGTDALFIALKAIGIGQGDEVITVSYTAVPTVSAIVSAGATPVFVDIDPRTFLMDTSHLEKAITHQTKCIIPVHLYGQCVNMDPVRELARSKNIKIIEDCAQAHGATYKENKAGSMSDLAAFSFYPTKILGGYGDAGMILTSDEELYQKVRKLRFYGMEKEYNALEHGYNSRLDELHAAILLYKLSKIERYINTRRQIADTYHENLNGLSLELPKTAAHNEHAYYLYVVKHPKRDDILKKLHEENIMANISYRWPVHQMQAYRGISKRIDGLDHSDAAANEVFSLPIYPGLSSAQQESTMKALKDIVKSI